MATNEPCPACGGELRQPITRQSAFISVNCHACGEHVFVGAPGEGPLLKVPAQVRAQLAHGLTKVPKGTTLFPNELEKLASATQLPRALERIDNLVLLFAEDLEVGQIVELNAHHLWAKLGCMQAGEVDWVVTQAVELGLISRSNGTRRLYSLSAAGWKRYAELLRDGARSTHAFMAMKFGTEMQRVLEDHMRPAVAQTGFDLRTTVGDHQTAGSIDNRMRVEIRTSRFVLCDLTHGNQGAYWEAGFAEGLGRPVIYTCRRDVLETPKAVHFDTDHQLIIKWDPADMAAAMQELKATIRATLPAEAKMED